MSILDSIKKLFSGSLKTSQIRKIASNVHQETTENVKKQEQQFITAFHKVAEEYSLKDVYNLILYPLENFASKKDIKDILASYSEAYEAQAINDDAIDEENDLEKITANELSQFGKNFCPVSSSHITNSTMEKLLENAKLVKAIKGTETFVKANMNVLLSKIDLDDDKNGVNSIEQMIKIVEQIGIQHSKVSQYKHLENDLGLQLENYVSFAIENYTLSSSAKNDNEKFKIAPKKLKAIVASKLQSKIASHSSDIDALTFLQGNNFQAFFKDINDLQDTTAKLNETLDKNKDFQAEIDKIEDMEIAFADIKSKTQNSIKEQSAWVETDNPALTKNILSRQNLFLNSLNDFAANSANSYKTPDGKFIVPFNDGKKKIVSDTTSLEDFIDTDEDMVDDSEINLHYIKNATDDKKYFYSNDQINFMFKMYYQLYVELNTPDKENSPVNNYFLEVENIEGLKGLEATFNDDLTQAIISDEAFSDKISAEEKERNIQAIKQGYLSNPALLRDKLSQSFQDLEIEQFQLLEDFMLKNQNTLMAYFGSEAVNAVSDTHIVNFIENNKKDFENFIKHKTVTNELNQLVSEKAKLVEEQKVEKESLAVQNDQLYDIRENIDDLVNLVVDISQYLEEQGIDVTKDLDAKEVSEFFSIYNNFGPNKLGSNWTKENVEKMATLSKHFIPALLTKVIDSWNSYEDSVNKDLNILLQNKKYSADVIRIMKENLSRDQLEKLTKVYDAINNENIYSAYNESQGGDKSLDEPNEEPIVEEDVVVEEEPVIEEQPIIEEEVDVDEEPIIKEQSPVEEDVVYEEVINEDEIIEGTIVEEPVIKKIVVQDENDVNVQSNDNDVNDFNEEDKDVIISDDEDGINIC